jgi:hypothetical protein
MEKPVQGQDEIEALLANAPIVGRFDPDVPIQTGTHSSPGIDTVIIEGGLHAIIKVGCEPAPGAAGARREVGAFRIAKAMGCGHLVATAALRKEREASGNLVDTAAIEFFDDRAEDASLGGFSSEEIARAGVFDAVIGQPDRGHNWLAVPATRPHRLKLFDHELALQANQTLDTVTSAFWNEIGKQVPQQLRQVVSDLLARLPSLDLTPSLLGADEYSSLEERLKRLRASY